jgi:outer membrane receptor for ferrienterochelin and colicin
MYNKSLIKACVAAVIIGASQMTNAASGDGSIVGHINATGDKSLLSGAEVTARNPATGLSRTVKTEADGSYRFPYLPVGTYSIEARKDGKSLGTLDDVTVNLGAATTADMDLGGESLSVITVVASRVVNAVDVSSTESAMNITREQIDQLPVERDLQSVAMLSPGISKGHNFGGGAGLSFGGSSVAENAIYINGLNVTDFYNRIGFSSVPFAFYDQFQVKTGGYSVEFGRTTGGVINAVTRKGTNDFEFGTEVTYEPDWLQASKSNHPGVLGQYDQYNRTNVDVYAGGPIIKDKLFFFALYEFRDYNPVNTSDSGETFDDAQDDDGFWGAKIDWQINDRNLVELLGFSDKNQTITDTFDFDADNGEVGTFRDRRFEDEGGKNWALTYTSYISDSFSAKALYGENERHFSRVAQNDLDCSRVRDRRGDSIEDVGCTSTPNIITRTDTREEARLDFEWALGSHGLRFGFDHESNVSQHNQYYPGPDRLLYEVYLIDDQPNLENGAPVPNGITEFVRTRQNEVDGQFETLNSAYYLEDNWAVTDTLLLNAGIRLESFDNRNSDGDSYIKMDNMLAPRLGFSWDMKGDGRTKLFGNAGRYYLPVANVINIKQAGGFLDARNWYVFEGFEEFDYNGTTSERPILGDKVGDTDTTQGDGSVGDLRAEVDKNMDPVYQDEFILGFQTMINEQWSVGVRGTYRRLTNAIDDMAITSTGVMCDGGPVDNGYVMGNPGRVATIYSDTDCDGENDAYVNVDTSKGGWAMYDYDDNYIGDHGYEKPSRNYKSLEFVADRAWDGKWSLNAAYTLSWNKGNAEGPVNTDTDFGDTGRTENFDDPWVNYGAYGYLPNDHRHQIKLRGMYGFGSDWRVGVTLDAQSGRPISAFGSGNPFDSENYHSFFVCTANCGSADAEYELLGRGSQGRTPWVYDLGANITWQHSFGETDVMVKLAVYNLLNQERVLEVDESYRPTSEDNSFGVGTAWFAPRYGQLILTVKF